MSKNFEKHRPSFLLPVNSGVRYRELSLALLDSSETNVNFKHLKRVCTFQSDLECLSSLIFNWFNLTLVFLPLGILSSFLQWNELFTFWFNFLSLIPLANILASLTEEIALHSGDIVSGILSATLGNAVEIIITIQSLRANLLQIVQGTLLGSILSNLLLVLGLSFFCGGLFHFVQIFNAQGAMHNISLLLLACLGFITPTIGLSENMSSTKILTISRLIATIIAITYCLFLYFQLKTHHSLFNSENLVDEDELATETTCMSPFTAFLSLVCVSLLISLSSNCFVNSIEAVTRTSGISESFIGVILIPVVANAAEHLTAITVAIKNKPDLTMAVAVGSSTQIALFMVPFSVLAGWALGVPMTLAFSKVSVAVLTFSILIVLGVVQDGKSNWLEGIMLITAYCIIAITFWFQDPYTA